MKAHDHQARFVMGDYPVAAVCREEGCDHVLIANGGGWVTPEEAQALKDDLPMARLSKALGGR